MANAEKNDGEQMGAKDVLVKKVEEVQRKIKKEPNKEKGDAKEENDEEDEKEDNKVKTNPYSMESIGNRVIGFLESMDKGKTGKVTLNNKLIIDIQEEKEFYNKDGFCNRMVQLAIKLGKDPFTKLVNNVVSGKGKAKGKAIELFLKEMQKVRKARDEKSYSEVSECSASLMKRPKEILKPTGFILSFMEFFNVMKFLIKECPDGAYIKLDSPIHTIFLHVKDKSFILYDPNVSYNEIQEKELEENEVKKLDSLYLTCPISCFSDDKLDESGALFLTSIVLALHCHDPNFNLGLDTSFSLMVSVLSKNEGKKIEQPSLLNFSKGVGVESILNRACYYGWNILSIIASSHDVSALGKILAALNKDFSPLKKALNVPNKKKETPLMIAANRGNLDIFKRYVESSDPKSISKEVFIHAIKSSDEKKVALLIETVRTVGKDAALNLLKNTQAIIVAIEKQNLAIVKLLVNLGISVAIKDENTGYNAFYTAIMLEDKAIVNYLVDAPKKVKGIKEAINVVCDKDIGTPLDILELEDKKENGVLISKMKKLGAKNRQDLGKSLKDKINVDNKPIKSDAMLNVEDKTFDKLSSEEDASNENNKPGKGFNPK